MDEQLLVRTIHVAARGLEVAGTLVIVLGVLVSAVRLILHRPANRAAFPLQDFRSSLGGAILVGLELMVAAGIINTVVLQPTLQSLAVLAGVVAIRTFLSFSLQVELEGAWPWAGPTKENYHG